MDRRIMFVVLGVAALALAGLAFAAGGQGWNAGGIGPQDWNGTHMKWNGTRMMPPNGGNETFRGHGMMRGEGNGTRAAPANMTAVKEAKDQFDSAVLSDDYATAKNLSEMYGFGGPVFKKLNETTFATVSQIASLDSQLRQQLGLNATGNMPPIGNMQIGGMRGMGGWNVPGVRSGQGMMGPEFAKGMRQNFRQGANQNTNKTQQQ